MRAARIVFGGITVLAVVVLVFLLAADWVD
jgi:hypothetical protein